MTNTGLTRLD